MTHESTAARLRAVFAAQADRAESAGKAGAAELIRDAERCINSLIDRDAAALGRAIVAALDA